MAISRITPFKIRFAYLAIPGLVLLLSLLQPQVRVKGQSEQVLTGHLEFNHLQETTNPHMANWGINYLHEMCQPKIIITTVEMFGECTVIDGTSPQEIPGDHLWGAAINGKLKGTAVPGGAIEFTYTITSVYMKGDPNWEVTETIAFKGTGKFTSSKTAEGIASYTSACTAVSRDSTFCRGSSSNSFSGTIPWKFIRESGAIYANVTPGQIPGKDPYVEIVAITGDISTKTGTGEWVESSVGQKLGANVEIHAGPESTATLRFPDGSTLVVRQLTQMMIGPLLDQATRYRIELLLELGNVKANVQDRETVRSDFSIRTPVATASVRGTVFEVSYDDKTGTTTVSVEEGEVLVTPANTAQAPATLTAGQQAQVTMESVDAPAAGPSAAPGSWSLLTPGQRTIAGSVVCVGLIVLLVMLVVGLVSRLGGKRPA